MRIDVTQRVGLDLILPVAALLPLERRVQWSEQMKIPLQVLDTLADGADALALVLTGGLLDTFIRKLPKYGALLSKVAVPTLLVAVRMSHDKLVQINESARATHDYLTATLTQFKLDLDQGERDKLLIRKKG